MNKNKLLVIGAHSADFVWRSAGTIALLTSQGAEAIVIALSFGERGESGELWKEPGQTVENVKRVRQEQASAASNAAAVKNADLILSANVAAVAVDVAREVLPCLKASQIYADLNTCSPQIKQTINQVLENSPVLFADVAIMAPIAPKRIATPLIASGNGAAQFAQIFLQFGSPVTAIDQPAGYAATLKLVRSIFYKGLAAVVMETLEAAEKLNLSTYAREQMLTILQDGATIDHFVSGTRKHARRRLHEMEAVIELLQSIDVQPHTSTAARQRMID